MPITAGNRRTHPKIEAIRATVEAIEAAIASGRWTREEKATCEPPAIETRRVVHRDWLECVVDPIGSSR